MCGIAGIWRLDGQRVDRETLVSMRDELVHRGPNDRGIYVNSHLGLGHTRLSIIDLSSSGHQPMSSEAEDLWLVYNGEIYNFQTLRTELEGLGHRFRSRTDTEVILHAYRQWGTNCVSRLNGMFAFALWDRNQRTLWLARDRLGVKPLFYYLDDRQLVFGSEIKSILKATDIDRNLNWQSFSDFLSMNFIPPPDTPFRGIKALLPGHYLLHDGSAAKITQYWNLQFRGATEYTEAEHQERVRAKLEECVRKRLVADVPIGAFLSGGLDSSAVVYFLKKLGANPLKTFNVSFDEASYDESSFALIMSRKLGTEHFEVRCRPADLQTNFDNLVQHSDHLVADNSNLAMYLVSKLAGEHVRVVLTGDGGDEIFGGYPTYQADLLLASYQRLPAVVKNSAQRLATRIPQSTRKLSWQFKVKRFIEGAQFSAAKAHYWWRIIFSDDEKRKLIRPEFQNLMTTKDSADASVYYYNHIDVDDPLQRSFYSDIKVFLSGSILGKVDTMTMAHSLEGRSPFLDYEMVELAAAIPSSLKVRGAGTKYILKRAMHDLLPSEIIARNKSGFNLPLGTWFREDLRTFVEEVLNTEAIRNIEFLNCAFVEKLKQEHFSGKQNHDYRLWGLMTLVRWMETYH